MHQWFSLVLITAGLVVSAFGGSGKSRNANVLGILAGLGGALGYSGVYVLSEKVLSEPGAPSSFSLCAFDGLFNTTILIIYFMVYVGPNWGILVADRASADYEALVIAYATTIVAYCLHNLTFFYIAGRSGAVSLGELRSCLQNVCYLPF
jgi:drug/metabolite transporter (DMT)-like permease